MNRALETRIAKLEEMRQTGADLMPLLVVHWPEDGTEAEHEACRRGITEQEKRYRLVLVIRRAESEL